LKTKSLLPSLYKREEFPLFGKEGLGEILQQYVFSIMDSLVFKKLVEIPGGGFEEKVIEFMGPTQAT
jgi:hypothetical protein